MARRLDEPQGRGEFFTSLGRLLGGFVAGQVEEAVVGSGPKLLRPPGALPEFAFLAACTRCDRCLQACPQAAILKASGRARLAVNTPYLDPRAMACFLCTGLPCIPACPAGALVWPRRTVKGAVQEGPRAVKMGTAVVKRNLCLTWKAEAREAIPCRTCWARCPFPDPGHVEHFHQNQDDDDPLQALVLAGGQQVQHPGPGIGQVIDLLLKGGQALLQIEGVIQGPIEAGQGLALPGFRRVVEQREVLQHRRPDLHGKTHQLQGFPVAEFQAAPGPQGMDHRLDPGQGLAHGPLEVFQGHALGQGQGNNLEAVQGQFPQLHFIEAHVIGGGA